MRLSNLGCFIVALMLVATTGSTRGTEADSLVLKNRYVLRELRRVDGSWRTVRFARADGSDAVDVQSDEFHILPLDSERGWTIADYVAAGQPIREEADGATVVRISYRQRRPLPEPAPKHGNSDLHARHRSHAPQDRFTRDEGRRDNRSTASRTILDGQERIARWIWAACIHRKLVLRHRLPGLLQLA